MCRFCKEEDEDIMHVFYHCPYVANFWDSIWKWLMDFRIKLDISPMNIIVGIVKDHLSKLVNTIILIGKMVIFKSNTNVDLCLTYFKNKLYLQYRTGKKKARNNRKSRLHHKKRELLKWDWCGGMLNFQKKSVSCLQGSRVEKNHVCVFLDTF